MSARGQFRIDISTLAVETVAEQQETPRHAWELEGVLVVGSYGTPQSVTRQKVWPGNGDRKFGRASG
jgi:hypothetical protein